MTSPAQTQVESSPPVARATPPDATVPGRQVPGALAVSASPSAPAATTWVPKHAPALITATRYPGPPTPMAAAPGIDMGSPQLAPPSAVACTLASSQRTAAEASSIAATCTATAHGP